MDEASQELGSRWTKGGVVRALVVGGLAWAIGSGLGYLVSHEKTPENRRAGAPAASAASGPGDSPPMQAPPPP